MEAALTLDGKMVLDLSLIRIQTVEQNVRRCGGFLGDWLLPGGAHTAGNFG
jgi:hypothetical protein